VSTIESDRVVLADGREIATRCVVWAGGLRPRDFDGADRFRRVKGGRIAVGSDHRVEGWPGVYAMGDIAAALGADGAPLPQLGSVALQAGHAVADSILAEIDGRPAPEFRYHDKGIMAMIGRNAAVVEVGAHRHHELHGPVAFSAWLGIHAWLLSGSRARIDAFLAWAWDSFSTNRSPAVIEDPDRARIDWGDGDDAAPEAATAQSDAKGSAS
jgi:NADH dehydrogenase